MTDLAGYLEPCGCQSRPLGGIDKAAAQLEALRADGVPSVFVAAGDLFFEQDKQHEPALDGAASDAAAQARLQAETLAGILGRLELVAATPGAADRARGAQTLRELASIGKLRLFGSSPSASGESSSLLLQRGGVTAGVFGLADAESAQLAQRAQQLTDALRAQGATVVIGLLAADARVARRVAGATRGLDLLVHGGIDRPEVPAPERVGGTMLLRAAHRGHGLLVVDLVRAGEGPFLDVSEWTRKARKQALARTIEELRARMAEWKRDPKVHRTRLGEQEARLARLRSEIAALDRPLPATGNTLSARFIELGPEAPVDREVGALLDAHDVRVNEHNRVALDDVLPKPVPKGMPGYLGSARCGECHAPALAWWKGHAHGRAYATLEQRNKQFSLSCVGCHVTGYNQPGGASVVHNQGLTDVGCESCHGPGSLHARDPDVEVAKNVRRDTAESVCKQCHNPEHSDRFVYGAYRAQLLAPGHGLPVRAEAAP